MTRKRVTVLSSLLILALVLNVGRSSAAPSASVDTVQFSTTPALSPVFNPAVSDYVVRCTNSTPVQVSVSNSDGSDTTTSVSVDGQSPRTGAFTAQVSLNLGQGFTITVTQGTTSKNYYVRCLPNGFPTWSSQRPGSPQAEYYVVVPVPSTGVGIANRYITLYDTNGVPIWWILPPNPHRPVYAKLLPNTDILWTESDTSSSINGLKAEHRRLDGSIVDDNITPIGYQLDAHEAQLLPNGNYLLIGTYGKCCFNLSSYGGPSSATIRDSVIQEVTPGGTAVWTWLAGNHIGLDELQQQWAATFVQAGSPYDVFHLNSAVIDATGDVLISFRHLNAIYKITNPTAQTNPGKVIWKLGGSAPTIEPGTRLTVSGDPIFTSGGGFGGQHYPRYFDAGDGNLYVTLHDNGSSLGRPPRGVRYRINEAAKTATLIEDVRDTASPNMTSPCCGSAGKLPTGNWVMSWGQNTLMTELTPSGSRVFALTFGAHSYRVEPVMPGVLTREMLRNGMNSQYPRSTPPTSTPTSTATATRTSTATNTSAPPTASATATNTPTPVPSTNTPTNTPVSASTSIVSVTFQYGASGYSGTVDTFLRGTTAGNTNFNSDTGLEWDDNSGTTTDEMMLIRFANIFASEGGPIPNGATITSASLTYMTTNLSGSSTAEGDPANVYESLVDWVGSSVTYNNFGGDAGVQADEYNATLIASASATAASTQYTIDVTTSLQRWSDGMANYGWIFLPTADDGVTLYSSDHATVANHPRLTVTYTTGPVNHAPAQPILVQPSNGSTGLSTSPTLQVMLTDQDSDPLNVTFYGRPTGSLNPGADFTIIAMPDTQHYTDGVGDAANFAAQTQWIVDNKASRNIVFVTGLGDIVENGNANDSEWQLANNAYSLIENPLTTLLLDGIPYGLAVGNHDQSPIGGGSSASTTKYNQYFGASRFAGRGYYGGHFGSDNDNNYELFSASGMDFIVIHFEYDTTPEQAVLDWADNLLTTYSNRRAILTTHYMINTGNPGSWGAQGQALYNALSDHPNLFLMLGGHIHGEGRRQDTAVNGNVVTTLLSDYQDYPNGGNGFLRMMTFSPANDTISVQTYSPVLGQFETDANSQFTLSYDLGGSAAFQVIGSNNNVPSGSTTSITWTGLDDGAGYEWYVTVSDGSAVTTSNTWNFSTGGASATNTATASATPTNPATNTPTPVPPTATNTPLPTNTPTRTSTATNTPAPPTNTATPVPPTSTNTPLPANTSTNTPTATASATQPGGVNNTGWISPQAQAAQSGGDGNGYQTSPANAFADAGGVASDVNSGNSSSTNCASTGKDRHAFFNYPITLPAGATINGIEVRLDARADSTSSAPHMCVEISWNNGTSWTAVKQNPNLLTTERSDILGGATDTWGHTWNTSELSSTTFRVRITNVSSSTSRDFFLDWAPVRITYTSGGGVTSTATPTASATPTNTPTPTRTATVSNTPLPTNTPTSSNTPLPTNTSAPPTNTPTRTNTPAPSNTPTATNTSLPTNTPTASATPIPPTATSTSSNTPTASATATTSAPGPTTITVQISNSTDDVNQDGTTLASTSSTLWLGTAASTTSSYTGLRFNNLNIPPGASITSAHLEVYSSQSQWISISFSMAAENSGNSPTFSTGNLPSQRALTTQTVSHSSNVQWLANTWYSLNEIAAVIQAVINRPDWQSGNSLSIILKGGGSAWSRKFVTSMNGSATNAPRLVITYSVP